MAARVAFGRLHQFSREQLLPRRHTALLVALVVAFSVRPLIGDSGFGPVGFSIALIVLMLVSLYTVQVDELIGERERLVVQKRRRSRIGWLLAIPAIAERVVIPLTHNPDVIVAGLTFWLLFFGYITWNELRALLKHKQVTTETICMSISVYLLLGLTWGVLYILIFYLQPHSFSFPNALNTPSHSGQGIFPILVYFSLVTISTVGFGDISPLSLQARYAAVAEAITGQFYLAILVARLVGLYMSRTASHHTGDQSRGSRT